MAVTINELTTTTALTGADLFVVRKAGETVDKAVTLADMRLAMQQNSRRVFVVDKGAKFDGVQLTDVATTNGSATVSSPSYTFTAADVGKIAVFKDSVTATSYRFRGTIASVSGGNAVLSSTLATAQSAGVLEFGTDDTAAIQAAIDAVNPEDSSWGSGVWKYRYKGVVTFPAGLAMVTKEFKLRTGVAFEGQGPFATRLLWGYPGNMATTDYYAMFHGGGASGSTRLYKDIQFRNFCIDMNPALNPSNDYHAKCVEIIYAVRLSAVNMFFDGSPATSFGCDYVSGALIHGCYFRNSGRLWSSGGGGGSGMDFQTYVGNYTADNVLEGREHAIFSNNIFINPQVSAIRFTDNNATNRAVNQAIMIGNIIITNKTTTSKGIDDNSSTGAVIIGNSILNEATQTTPGTTAQHQWSGIQTTGGKNGVIVGNTVRGYYDGILIGRGNGGIQPDTYTVANNNVAGAVRHGIRVEADSTYTAKRFNITGNMVTSCGASGIALSNTGSAGNLGNVAIIGNSILDNGQTTSTDADRSGIYINTPTSGLHIANNYIYDSGAAKQKYGITIDTVAVTDAFVTGNHISSNTTSALNFVSTGYIAGEVTNNKGYHPGAVSVSPGASPYTYTAGFTPEVIYISGGTVSGITKDGVTMPTSGAFHLGPNESIIITYSSAPNIVADKK